MTCWNWPDRGLPDAFRRRDIRLTSLGEARWSRTPMFVKQPREKALPAAVVDVGLTSDADRGDEHWAVVEADMAWFSSCYAADPGRVLDVVLRSAGPRHRPAVRDRALVSAKRCWLQYGAPNLPPRSMAIFQDRPPRET